MSFVCAWKYVMNQNFHSCFFLVDIKENGAENEDNDSELSNLITAAAERVWNVFYTHKKNVRRALCYNTILTSMEPFPIRESLCSSFVEFQFSM